MRRRVAVIGASNDRRKYGNKAVRAFQAQGYVVYPINPHEVAIEGLPAFAIPWISYSDIMPVLIGGCAVALVAFADTSVL